MPRGKRHSGRAAEFRCPQRPLPSFDACYGPFERGGGSTGQALAGLSEELRRSIREEVRAGLGDTGGPVKPEAEYRIASGQR